MCVCPRWLCLHVLPTDWFNSEKIALLFLWYCTLLQISKLNPKKNESDYYHMDSHCISLDDLVYSIYIESVLTHSGLKKSPLSYRTRDIIKDFLQWKSSYCDSNITKVCKFNSCDSGHVVRQNTSHYLKQYWPNAMTQIYLTMPEWPIISNFSAYCPSAYMQLIYICHVNQLWHDNLM